MQSSPPASSDITLAPFALPTPRTPRPTIRPAFWRTVAVLPLFVALWCLTVLATLTLSAMTLYHGWTYSYANRITTFPFTSFPLVPAALTAVAWWAGLRRRPVWGVAGALLLAPVMVYLATDDAEWRAPISLEEVAPTFAGEGESEAVLMRYAKDSEATKAWRAPAGLPEKWPGVGTPEWEALVKTNSTAIAAAWAGTNPVRDWWSEWSALPRLGDTNTLAKSGPSLDFTVLRDHVRLATAEAGRLALAGEGDAALAVLEPLLIGGQQLALSGRSAVRFMLGSFTQRLALKAAQFVLDRTPVSAEARERLVAVLARAEDGEKSIRRLFAAEYAQATRAILVDMRLETDRSFLGGILSDGFMDRVLINPKRTANRLYEVMQEVGERAVRRDAKGAEELILRFIKEGGGASSIKNIHGGMLAVISVPAPGGIIRTHWEVEDRRAALLATLRGEPRPTLSTQNQEAKP
jgi:hypothetical protein